MEFSDEIFAITVRDELLRQLYCYIKELPDGAEIMELSVLGLSGPEIAEKLGITIHTVKTQKNRSFKYLRERLKGFSSVVFNFNQNFYIFVILFKTSCIIRSNDLLLMFRVFTGITVNTWMNKITGDEIGFA